MWSVNPIKKKVENKDLIGKIQIKVGISAKTQNATALSEKLGIAIIEYIKSKKIENVIVYQREFYGYEGDEPTLEIVIPEKGAVVFGKIDVEKGLKLVDKYVINTSEIIDFLVDNNGTKKCNHNH